MSKTPNLNDVTNANPIGVKFGPQHVGAKINPTIWFHAVDVAHFRKVMFRQLWSRVPIVMRTEDSAEDVDFDLLGDQMSFRL